MNRALLCLAFTAACTATPLLTGTAAAKAGKAGDGVDHTDLRPGHVQHGGRHALRDEHVRFAGARPDHDDLQPHNSAEFADVRHLGIAAFASISPWTYTKGGGLVGECGGGVALPANLSCGERNYGAKLQIH